MTSLLRLSPLLLVLIAQLPNAAEAATSNLQSRISDVTVYQGQARVTRHSEVSLAAGTHQIVQDGLPANLDPSSLRINVENGALQILSLGSERVPTSALSNPRERTLQQELENLQEAQGRQADAQATAQLQLKFLESLGQGYAKQADVALATGKANPGDWPAAWNTLGAGSIEALSKLRAAGNEKRRIEEEISRVQRELKQLRSGQRHHYRLTLQVHAPKAGASRLSISYVVRGAHWAPRYQAALNSESNKIELRAQAAVRQNTGEDWEDVRLVLSTGQPSRSTQPPTLQPWFLDYQQPRPMAQRSRAFHDGAGMAMDTLEEAMPAAAPVMAPPPVAEVAAGGFTTEFRLKGKLDVSADNNPQVYLIDRHQLNAELLIVTAPSRDQRAYLQAKSAYQGAALLLPGEIELLRDNDLVGKSRLGLLRSGDELTLGFGVDDLVEVRLQEMAGKKAEHGIFSKSKQITRGFRIEITNRHKQPVSVQVRERMPVPRPDDVTVTLTDKSTPPNVKALDDKPGVLAWNIKLAPGKTRKLRFGYRVEYPADKTLPGF